ncbi:MAG: MFS transporter [Chloroflexi bacterium]|nr:MFS transporter [Chloroflexota bacterium]MCH8007968.1 MFS transporter [Chloroflexota bacterium]MCH8160647.1 MFS transporter [Chloroflexota bacterium]
MTGMPTPGADQPAPPAAFRLFYVFLPETSILRRVRFQIVFLSRLLSEIGHEAIMYGSLVAVAAGGSVFEAALVGMAALVPAAALGLYAGTVSDTLPKRVALGLGYGLQGLLCFLVPVAFGTSLGPILVLVASVSLINQVVGPSEKAVIPLVASREEICTAASLLSFSDSIATAIGTALLAPFVVKLWGVGPLFFVCGVFLLLASIRVFSLPLRKHIGVREALSKVDLSERDLGVPVALRWLANHPAIGSMIMIGLIVSVLNTISATLGPIYVRDVLHADPTNTVYVFAPAGVGALVAMAFAPRLIDRIGERMSAAIGFLIATVSLFLLGAVDFVSPVLAPISAMNALFVVGIDPGEEVRAAGSIALFAGFATTLTAVAVQIYINRRVPVLQQGRTFGLQNVLTNAAAMVPLLALGGLAVRTGVEPILLVAPWIVLIGAYVLILLASRYAGREAPTGLEVLSTFWEEPPARPSVALGRNFVSAGGPSDEERGGE